MHDANPFILVHSMTYEDAITALITSRQIAVRAYTEGSFFLSVENLVRAQDAFDEADTEIMLVKYLQGYIRAFG